MPIVEWILIFDIMFLNILRDFLNKKIKLDKAHYLKLD